MAGKDSAQYFTQHLSYDDGPVPQFNGNISAQSWVSNGSAIKSYTYLYDKLNRLSSGISGTGYNEQGITYDKMGNIKTLARYNNGTVLDSLVYHYPNNGLSNQPDIISDLSGNTLGVPTTPMTYTYNGDGLMTHDGRNGNNITYNLLDLPMTVTGASNITFTYDAEGKKLRKAVVVGSTATYTDYIDGIQYTTVNTGAPKMDFVQTAEGRARLISTSFNYEYDLKDHLGNNRLTFDVVTGAARPVQGDDYYPFGLEISSTGPLGIKNFYLYNNKELQEELVQYDYGARFYDPLIARWNVFDKYAEHPDQINLSPYIYVGNNPINKTDPDGNCPPCDVPNNKKSSAGGSNCGNCNVPFVNKSGMVFQSNGVDNSHSKSFSHVTVKADVKLSFGMQAKAVAGPAGKVGVDFGSVVLNKVSATYEKGKFTEATGSVFNKNYDLKTGNSSYDPKGVEMDHSIFFEPAQTGFDAGLTHQVNSDMVSSNTEAAAQGKIGGVAYQVKDGGQGSNGFKSNGLDTEFGIALILGINIHININFNDDK